VLPPENARWTCSFTVQWYSFQQHCTRRSELWELGTSHWFEHHLVYRAWERWWWRSIWLPFLSQVWRCVSLLSSHMRHYCTCGSSSLFGVLVYIILCTFLHWKVPSRCLHSSQGMRYIFGGISHHWGSSKVSFHIGQCISTYLKACFTIWRVTWTFWHTSEACLHLYRGMPTLWGNIREFYVILEGQMRKNREAPLLLRLYGIFHGERWSQDLFHTPIQSTNSKKGGAPHLWIWHVASKHLLQGQMPIFVGMPFNKGGYDNDPWSLLGGRPT